MAFLLTITQGDEAGTKLNFEQPEVTIGRTPECDVLLQESGVSRQHARIAWDGVGYVVEDLGSANGTKVNGAVVKKRQVLKAGDSIGVGPVVFSFAPKPAANVVEQSTRIVNANDVRRSKPTPAPSPAELAEIMPEEKDQTRIVAASEVRRNSMGTGKAAVSAPPSSSSLPRKVDSASPLAANRRPSMPSSNSTPRGQLSAAQRARLRREATGLEGGLQLFWMDATPGQRRFVAVAMAMVVLGAMAIPARFVLSQRPVHKAEPQVLTREPIRETFGLGADVDFTHIDKKRFEFDFTSPVRAVEILHYQAKGISDGEVTLSVNGDVLGTIPPDTLNADSRTLELVVPVAVLKKGERNSLLFNNTHNPKRQDFWRVWNLWVETAPLPDVPPDEAERQANDAYNRGLADMRGRDIDKSNRYRAWREFRAAWLLLEGLPEPRPETYRLALARMREAQIELDTQCSKLLMEAERAAVQRNYQDVDAVLTEVKEWFPSNEQACPARAEQKRQDYGLN
jgi:hypothetical protein